MAIQDTCIRLFGRPPLRSLGEIVIWIGVSIAHLLLRELGSEGLKKFSVFLFIKFLCKARTIAVARELVYPGKTRIYLPAESRMAI